MPRQKKSRKIGQLGIPSVPKAKRKPKESDRKNKKTLGKPAGSRNNQEQQKQEFRIGKQSKDPRLGSKKPVQLIVNETKNEVIPKKIRHFSPSQELNEIEHDERLSLLLENIDSGKRLKAEDKQYVDSKMTRHKELCSILGIEEEPEVIDEKLESESDLYSQFEAINIDDFKE